MSGQPDRSHTPTVPEKAGGLSLEQFLSALDWAGDTHASSTSSEEEPPRCITCTRHLSDSPSHHAVSGDHILGFAVFRVTNLHQLAFSSPRPSVAPLTRVRATLSLVDASMRIALELPSNGWRCLTLQHSMMLKEPTVENSQLHCSLSMVFPFVILSFGKELTVGENVTPDRRSEVWGLQFEAMRSAIIDLWNSRSKLGPACATKTEQTDHKAVMSLHEKTLELARREIGRQNIVKGLSTFAVRGCAMVMPLAFPYKPLKSNFEGLSLDQSQQMLFFQSFLELEVAIQGANQQAASWVRRATRGPSTEPDNLLSRKGHGSQVNKPSQGTQT